MVPSDQRILVNSMIDDIEIARLNGSNSSRWNWTTYFDSLFENTDIIVDFEKDIVGLSDRSYFNELPSLMDKTSPGTIGTPY